MQTDSQRKANQLTGIERTNNRLSNLAGKLEKLEQFEKKRIPLERALKEIETVDEKIQTALARLEKLQLVAGPAYVMADRVLSLEERMEILNSSRFKADMETVISQVSAQMNKVDTTMRTESKMNLRAMAEIERRVMAIADKVDMEKIEKAIERMRNVLDSVEAFSYRLEALERLMAGFLKVREMDGHGAAEELGT